MLRIHKIAIARILTEIIKADHIININEMECYTRLCTKYSIDNVIENEAQLVSFSDALEFISNSDTQEMKESLLSDCRTMAISDGFCSHSEALIMIALILMLDPEVPYSVSSISIPKLNFNIDVATSLYIESDFDIDVNRAIQENYRFLYREFQLAGFHFIYTPKIIEHYRDTDSKLLCKILSLLAPSLSKSRIENSYESLLNMTTREFCKDLLCNKCGISEFRDTYPSLLIKIGNSLVGKEVYANYLKIEIDKDILTTVQSFFDKFSKLYNGDTYVVNTSEERGDQFHFHGFYKQLLEIFLTREDIKSRIIIDPYKQEIKFPDIDAKISGISRKERALYALLLCSGPDGINFKAPQYGAADLAKYNKRISEIQDKYRAIYSIFGGDEANTPDLGDSAIRRPIFSRLNRSLRNLPSLYNPDDYTIIRIRNGVYSVNVDDNLIFVRELNTDEPVRLKDSMMYRRWLEA